VTLDDTRFATVAGPVLVIAGNAPAIRVDAGELLVADGPREVVSGPVPPVAERMTTLRLSRAAPGIDRIVFIRPDGGYVTIGALRWIYDVGVSLIILDWEGEPVLAAGRPGRDQAALRRAQALLAGSRLGHEIMMQVTATKLRGQAAVVRLLGTDAGAIDRLAVEAGETTSPSRLLGFEAAAASIYWQAWQNVCAGLAATRSRGDGRSSDCAGLKEPASHNTRLLRVER